MSSLVSRDAFDLMVSGSYGAEKTVVATPEVGKQSVQNVHETSTMLATIVLLRM